MSSSISVKLYLLGDKNIRRFSIGDAIPATFDALVQTTRQLLGEENVKIPALVFKYQDVEGDWITFASEIEFKEALRNCSQLLRIKVLPAPISKPVEVKKDKTPEKKADKKKADKPVKKAEPFSIPNLGKNDVVVDITDSLSDVLPPELKAVLGTGKTPINKENQVAHPHVTCDGCGQHPLIGTRYKCKDCPDFDFCSKCHSAAKDIHNKTHSFVAIPFPRNHRFGNVVTHIIYENDHKKKKDKKNDKKKQPELKTELAPQSTSLVDQQAPVVTSVPIFVEQPKSVVPPAPVVIAPPQPVVVQPQPIVTVPQPVVVPPQPVATAPPQSVVLPQQPKKESKYTVQLDILREMGFSDESMNIEMLNKHNGNMQRVIEEFFARS